MPEGRTIMQPLSHSLSPKGRSALARLNVALSALPESDDLARSIAADLAVMSDGEAAGALRRVRRTLFETATIGDPQASETVLDGLLIAFEDRVRELRAAMIGH